MFKGRRRFAPRFMACLAVAFLAAGWTTELVAQSLDTNTLGEVLDAPNLVWTCGGFGSWQGQTTNTHDGVDAAQGGPVSSGIITQHAWLQTTVIGPGTISFWWEVGLTWRLGGGVRATFDIDGKNQAGISADNSGVSPMGWQPQVVPIPPGEHILKWTVIATGGCVAPAAGMIWIDEVTFSPDTVPVITAQPQSQVIRSGQAVTLSVNATGSSTLNYQWFLGRSGDTTHPIAKATASNYTVPSQKADAVFWVRVSNALGVTDSQTATITVAPCLTALPRTGQNLTIVLSGPVGARLRLLRSTDLLSWELLDLPQALVLTNGQATVELPITEDRRAFYQAILIP